MDLKAVVQDPRYNPTGTETTRVEKLRMDAEVHVVVADGMEQLRARGEYIDYAADETFQTAPGVVSSAEQLENNGTRMYYLQPQDFPELYAKKKERSAVAERAVRRVLGQLQPGSTVPTGATSETGSR